MGVFPRLKNPVSLSVAVHLLFFVVWAALIGQQAARNSPSRLTWIEVDPVSPEARKKLRDDKTRNRIVETQPGRRTQDAVPDAYLGKQNQTVDRETVSRVPSIRTGAAQARTQGESPQEQAQKPRSATPKSGALSRLGVPMLAPLEKPAPQTQRRPTGPWADPSQAEMAPQDYIKGLKPGEMTALNTREYAFYGYFQRIRDRLDQAWTGILREQLTKLFRAGRQLASEAEHTTKVLVTMDRGGQITRVQVLEESGTFDLDDAAVRAFNEAGPFPNPPSGMIDAKGTVEIRWDFVLRT